MGDLLEGVRLAEVSAGIESLDVADISCDSRQIKPGSLFFALKGFKDDGRRYISRAVSDGAVGVVLEDSGGLAPGRPGVPFVVVADVREALSQIAGRFFRYPYRAMKVAGITGTNGKTTVSYLVQGVLEAAGLRTGVIGTLGFFDGLRRVPSENTTPGVIALHRMMRALLESAKTHAVLEVSSHALDQERVRGIVFDSIVFTNLTQDHLDYHKTMENYFSAKKRIFQEYANDRTCCVVNVDDPFGRRLHGTLEAGRRVSFGFAPEADIRASDVQLDLAGSRLKLQTPEGPLSVVSGILGRHNVSNIMAAVAFGVGRGLSLEVIRRGIEQVPCVPGRLERIDNKRGFSVFIDYAHTEDALENVLESLRSILDNGRIITVFGCGGDRDHAKRPKMGMVASRLCDWVIVTSDNPRSEDPKEIIRQITSRMRAGKFEVEMDRRVAIRKALQRAREGDLVLIAGKGHETSQVIGETTRPFDDKFELVCLLGPEGQEKAGGDV